MITSGFPAKKTSPKKKAQQIIANRIHGALYTDQWEEDGMTDKEKELIFSQIEKIADRLAKLLGDAGNMI